ncbi:hypothetical protein [Grimontia marina]|uniref:Uncharacterized protein n=1 Tax=Grimontia marina TaxID=646534 RepID=A0A128FDC9_9GAMM|nr:hypothetical protein [Grimontia marina]CZF84822.1 hypothetical protein GMA8713_03264 [Grimontia marina]
MAASTPLKYLIAVLFVVLSLCGTALVYVNDQYNDLLAKQDFINKERDKLHELQIDFEKQNADSKVAFTQKKQELEKLQQHLKLEREKLESEKKAYESDIKQTLQESLAVKELQLRAQQAANDEKTIKLEEALAEVQDKKSELKREIDSYNEKALAFQSLYAEYSAVAIEAKAQAVAEQEIFVQMREFSKLGVNLRHQDWCDKDYTRRYYQAEGIVAQINSIARANGLSNKYSSFVLQNTRRIYNSSDGVCQSEKSQG